MEIQAFIEDGVFSPKLISEALLTTKSDIAKTLGLAQDVFSRAERLRAHKTQTRLREMLEILSRANQHTDSLLASYAWYRSKPIIGFGERTASSLVCDGHADYVHAYFDHIEAGGYA